MSLVFFNGKASDMWMLGASGYKVKIRGALYIRIVFKLSDLGMQFLLGKFPEAHWLRLIPHRYKIPYMKMEKVVKNTAVISAMTI